MLQVMYSVMQPKAEEMSLSRFQRVTLANQDIEKIVIVNKEMAEVFVKRDRLGSGAYAKIVAARALGLPVIMIDRPAIPARFRQKSWSR